MAQTDISQTTTSTLSTIADYSVDHATPDSPSEAKETFYDISEFPKWFGYYKNIPELKIAIDTLALWSVGKGWEADTSTAPIIENLSGWGEDTAEAIFNNLLVMKKVAGDAFAEIIRDPETGTLLNLKPLNPNSMRIIADEKGMIKRYEQRMSLGDKGDVKTFQPNKILHLSNNRVADEIHGQSVIKPVEWIIDARNEAMTDWRKVLHRNVVPMRIVEVDTDDSTEISNIKTQLKNASKDAEFLVVPKGNVSINETAPLLTDPQRWIEYLNNQFFESLGVPKVVVGGSQEFTESSAKIAYLTFEQVYSKEQRELEKDLENQIGLKITFNKPASLKNEVLSGEGKNGNNLQPSDTNATLQGRNV